MELQARHEGLSQRVDVTRNEDGTFSFTIVAMAGRMQTEFTFAAQPFLMFDLGIFEGTLTPEEAYGCAVVKDVPFELKISGYINPKADNSLYSFKHLPLEGQQ